MVAQNADHQHERNDGALGCEHAEGKHLKDKIMQLGQTKRRRRVEYANLGPTRRICKR